MGFFDLNHAASFFKGAFVLAAIAVAMVTLSPSPTIAVEAKQAVIAVKGLSCPVCAHRLEKVLAKLPGAEKAQVDLQKSQALVDFAPNTKVTNQEIGQKVRDAGFVPGMIDWQAVSNSNNKPPAVGGRGFHEAR